MSADRPTLDSGAPVLVLRVEGGDGQPERLLRISRPVAGHVLVHEWPAPEGDAPSAMHEVECRDLLADLEHAHRRRRGISADMIAVREWLRG